MPRGIKGSGPKKTKPKVAKPEIAKPIIAEPIIVEQVAAPTPTRTTRKRAPNRTRDERVAEIDATIALYKAKIATANKRKQELQVELKNAKFAELAAAMATSGLTIGQLIDIAKNAGQPQ